ncbi:hypothetical protein GDI3302 [Gluconacetobacter diazotrophicus PA1 5]|uniref:Uncharacterized protein n=1 Tax=Gluconacetobacter diazotrophicus (strain ATCC 49037 / DSM 5601 / CCUG 37298 / CIP 103539 / LMG 7603 / PAl5) TaxID=272568 RepID=A9H1E8_GLUDA|nr:hypothetical protein GDI3302 [Gluconacetobacter diazotrophicus PA1 5]
MVSAASRSRRRAAASLCQIASQSRIRAAGSGGSSGGSDRVISAGRVRGGASRHRAPESRSCYPP